MTSPRYLGPPKSEGELASAAALEEARNRTAGLQEVWLAGSAGFSYHLSCKYSIFQVGFGLPFSPLAAGC
jgi:hypothetical protein